MRRGRDRPPGHEAYAGHAVHPAAHDHPAPHGPCSRVSSGRRGAPSAESVGRNGPGMIGRVRTVLRYLGGTVLVSMLIVTGVVIGILRTAKSTTGHRPTPSWCSAPRSTTVSPSPVLRARLDHAAELYHAGVAPRIVTIGGGQAGDVTTEGDAGRDYLASLGIEAGALESVGVGDDTLASLRAARDDLADPELALRGAGHRPLACGAGPADRGRPGPGGAGVSIGAGEGPSVRDGVETRYVTRETLGILFYLLTGGSSGAGSTVV